MKKNVLLITGFSLFAFCLFFICSAVSSKAAPSGEGYNVLHFGAKGDGKSIDTKAIQDAIEKAAEDGGGTVFFPAGTYISGTLFLKNNITLHLEAGSILEGSKQLGDYPITKSKIRSYSDIYTNKSLIYAEGKENISITGRGTIDGNGAAFKVDHLRNDDGVRAKDDFAFYKTRPFLIRMINCKNIQIRDVTMLNSPMWMQYYLGCDDVRLENLKIHNHSNYNNDIIDIDGCRNVIIKGVIGDSDDDGITFKSTYGRVSENIVVSDCIMGSHCNGLKFGTETTGGFRNVTITNCVIRSSEVDRVISGSREGISAISLEIVDGAIMENVNISNIVIEGPKVPLFIRLGNRARKHFPEASEPPVGIMKNINISNVIAKASSKIGCSILGTPGDYIENLSLSNMRFICTGGGTEENVSAIIPENEKSYPEATSFGTFSAYGLFIRHVKGLELSNLTFELQKEDARPLMVFDDVHYGKVKDITVSEKHSTDKYTIRKNCTNLSIQDKKLK